MRAVLQRAGRAEVRVEGRIAGAIERGVVALIGVERGDTRRDAEYLAAKIAGARLWEDARGRIGLGLAEIGGEVLAISQFTLLGDLRRGLRPSWDRAAPAAEAEPLYQACVAALRTAGVAVSEGIFGAHMELELVNDGPVTVLLDSRREL